MTFVDALVEATVRVRLAVNDQHLLHYSCSNNLTARLLRMMVGIFVELDDWFVRETLVQNDERRGYAIARLALQNDWIEWV